MALNDKIGLLVIHGMGNQKEKFSEAMQKEINNRLGNQAGRFAWQEVFWADVLETPESELWKAMKSAKEPSGKAIPLDWEKIREYVVHNFGDALAYHRATEPGSAYSDIHERVSQKIALLKAQLPTATSPVVVLAHSLGGHIISNYLWDHQPPKAVNDGLEDLPTLAAMVTFGCNIPLFSLDFKKPRPIDVPDSRLKPPALVAASRWLNFIDRDDVLGWPLRVLYQMNPSLTQREQATVARIEDYEINAGNILTSWNPVAHSEYWEDNDFTIPTANYLLRLLAALDTV